MKGELSALTGAGSLLEANVAMLDDAARDKLMGASSIGSEPGFETVLAGAVQDGRHSRARVAELSHFVGQSRDFPDINHYWPHAVRAGSIR